MPTYAWSITKIHFLKSANIFEISLIFAAIHSYDNEIWIQVNSTLLPMGKMHPVVIH